MKNFKRFIGLVSAVALSAMMLTGCGGKSADMYMSNSVKEYEAPAVMAENSSTYGYDGGMDDYDEKVYLDSPDNADLTQASQDASASGRKLIKDVSVSLETLEFDKCCSMITSYAEQLGGYVEYSNLSNDSLYTYYSSEYRSMRHASYTIRIPNEKLDTYVNAVGDMGSVTGKNENTQDVTLSYLDVESRIKALEIQQERLFELLEKAETVDEIIQLEDRISQVTYELEAQESIRRNYDSLVSFSTVSMYITEVEHVTPVKQAPETVGERISAGLSETFYDLGEGFKDFAVWFVVNLPYIVVWAAIITGIVVFIVKLVKHKKKKNAKKRAEMLAAQQAAQQVQGQMYAQTQQAAQQVQGQMYAQTQQAAQQVPGQMYAQTQQAAQQVQAPSQDKSDCRPDSND